MASDRSSWLPGRRGARRDLDGVLAVLERADGLEAAASHGGRSEPLIEAVMLCAGKVQELTAPESVHFKAVERILEDLDPTDYETLRRVRGVLRAAAQIRKPLPASSLPRNAD